MNNEQKTTGNTNILIVDDNESLCRTMSFVLERKGYTVETATDGQEAVDRVKEMAFDIIFMDIKMPVMNGVDAYKEIKEIRPDTVVMMMTAYAVEDLIEEALKEGAHGVVYKPVDMEKVLALIQEALGNGEGGLILVVDDEPGICISLKNILTKKGYEVGTAGSGEDAIKMASEKGYEIILIDMKLPTINGLETYLAIKEVLPQAVAVMMTAHRQEMAELVEEALNNSAYTCIYKPFDMDRMLEMIAEIQERKKSG
ncbi:MAG: response regulator [Desulfobacteraceae bacterium]|nr:response regulator [Desulfobacteraceae bacterium]